MAGLIRIGPSVTWQSNSSLFRFVLDVTANAAPHSDLASELNFINDNNFQYLNIDDLQKHEREEFSGIVANHLLALVEAQLRADLPGRDGALKLLKELVDAVSARRS